MGSFEISRSALVDADPARVYDLVSDLHQWPAWSPWERSDTGLERTWSGAERGVGATYSWRGRRAGAGSMTITGATAERIEISLSFEKPFRATNETAFAIEATPAGGAAVTWTMRGERTGVLGVLSRVVPVDRLLGRDFERGLARLEETARG